MLDVVYNHLGPEGNYLAEYGPFFTAAYRTPWGDAINYDGAGSDGVRRFIVDNALYWLTEYHADALRLDAIHGIFDFSARHILQELAEAFHAQAGRLGRSAWLIAESDLNDARVIKPPAQGGHGIDAQWLDDFHHSLHTALNGERRGYFADFDGLPCLRKAITDGFVYDGQKSRCRGRRHGSSSRDCPGEQFVAFTQNHDQIANALQGIRSSKLLSLERQKVAAAMLFCAPFIPLLFMGQEYGETASFYYFTDHGDPALIEAVREGRRRETGAFLDGGEFADPQDIATFQRSKLDWSLHRKAPHSGLLEWHRDWIAMRKRHASLGNCRKSLVRTACDPQNRWLVVERGDPSGSRALLLCNFSDTAQAIEIPFQDVPWSLCLWSGAARYGPPAAEPPARIPANGPATVELAGTPRRSTSLVSLPLRRTSAASIRIRPAARGVVALGGDDAASPGWPGSARPLAPRVCRSGAWECARPARARSRPAGSGPGRDACARALRPRRAGFPSSAGYAGGAAFAGRAPDRGNRQGLECRRAGNHFR